MKIADYPEDRSDGRLSVLKAPDSRDRYLMDRLLRNLIQEHPEGPRYDIAPELTKKKVK
jgi:hypothetical protein